MRLYRNLKKAAEPPLLPSASESFLPFLAELNISKSFETNIFFSQKISLSFCIWPFNYSNIKSQVSKAKTKENFKKIWFQIMAIFSGSGGFAAVSLVFRADTFNSTNFNKIRSLSSKIRLIWRTQGFYIKSSIVHPYPPCLLHVKIVLSISNFQGLFL